MILDKISILSDYIKGYKIEKFEQVGRNIKLYIHITFIDQSDLYIKEIYIAGKQKYSYHWQDDNKNLICRWDNSPDWPDIKTYPHHKHLGKEVLHSFDTNIETIFHAIKANFEKKKFDP